MHPNGEIIKRAYVAFGRGDMPAVFGFLDEGIRWHVPGQSPLSGDYRGHDEVAAFSKSAWTYRKARCASMCMTWWPTSPASLLCAR